MVRPKDIPAKEWRRNGQWLIKAAEGGDLTEAKRLMPFANANARSYRGWKATALMRAADLGHAGIVRALLDRPEARPLAADANGTTALMMAAAHGHAEIVEILLPRSDPGARDGSRYTALMHAANSGNLRSFELLLPCSDPNAQGVDGLSPLMLACMGADSRADPGPTPDESDGWAAIAKLLLSTPGLDPNARDIDGQAAAHFLTSPGILRALLDHPGLDVSARALGGETLLMRAGRNRDGEAFQALLDDPRVDINARDDDGNTAFCHARGHSWGYGGYGAAMGNWFDRGLDLSPSAKALLARPDFNPNAKNNEGHTPLMTEAARSSPHGVAALLARPDIDAGAKNRDGDNALMLASCRGGAPIIELLLPRCDPLARNKEGLTAANIARRFDRRKSAELIEAHVFASSEAKEIALACGGKGEEAPRRPRSRSL